MACSSTLTSPAASARQCREGTAWIRPRSCAASRREGAAGRHPDTLMDVTRADGGHHDLRALADARGLAGPVALLRHRDEFEATYLAADSAESSAWRRMVAISTVTLTIDGREVTVPKGHRPSSTPPREAGVEVPHYCYHPAALRRPPCAASASWRWRGCASLQIPCNLLVRRGHGGSRWCAPIRTRRAPCEGVMEFLPHQPPARLPHLRPGRRVQAAGLRPPRQAGARALRVRAQARLRQRRLRRRPCSSTGTAASCARVACASWRRVARIPS